MTANRIVGGQAAESPIGWQVSVRQCAQGFCHFCGGTILDATTVMSAAHCFTTGQSMSGFFVTAGVVNRNDNSGQTIEIANGVWNADMPYQGNNNDFVILKLSSALSFNANVYPACLPDASHAPDTTGQTCFASGWGTLQSGNFITIFNFDDRKFFLTSHNILSSCFSKDCHKYLPPITLRH